MQAHDQNQFGTATHFEATQSMSNVMLRIADTLPPRYVADAQCKWVNIILQYTIDYGEFPVKYYE